jgi:hypothetical protein
LSIVLRGTTSLYAAARAIAITTTMKKVIFNLHLFINYGYIIAKIEEKVNQKKPNKINDLGAV